MDLGAWLGEYSQHRPHQGRWCYGKTPVESSWIPCRWHKRRSWWCEAEQAVRQHRTPSDPSDPGFAPHLPSGGETLPSNLSVHLAVWYTAEER